MAVLVFFAAAHQHAVFLPRSARLLLLFRGKKFITLFINPYSNLTY